MHVCIDELFVLQPGQPESEGPEGAEYATESCRFGMVIYASRHSLSACFGVRRIMQMGGFYGIA